MSFYVSKDEIITEETDSYLPSRNKKEISRIEFYSCEKLEDCQHQECWDCTIGHGEIIVGQDGLCNGCRRHRSDGHLPVYLRDGGTCHQETPPPADFLRYRRTSGNELMRIDAFVVR